MVGLVSARRWEKWIIKISIKLESSKELLNLGQGGRKSWKKGGKYF